jgi:quinol monooxygenase YgiN
MTYVVLLELLAADGRQDELGGLLREMLAETRSFEGCLSAEVCVEPGDPRCHVVLERWESRAASLDYRQARRDSGAGFAQRSSGLVESRAAARHLETI